MGNHPFFRCELLVFGEEKSIIVTISKSLEFLDGLQPFSVFASNALRRSWWFFTSFTETPRSTEGSVVLNNLTMIKSTKVWWNIRKKRCHFQIPQISNLIFSGKKTIVPRLQVIWLKLTWLQRFVCWYPMYPHFFVNCPKTSTKNPKGTSRLILLVQKSGLCTWKSFDQKTLHWSDNFGGAVPNGRFFFFFFSVGRYDY